METVKIVAWFNVFIVGFFGLGSVALLAGGAWTIIWLAWMAFWVLVGTFAQISDPSPDI